MAFNDNLLAILDQTVPYILQTVLKYVFVDDLIRVEESDLFEQEDGIVHNVQFSFDMMKHFNYSVNVRETINGLEHFGRCGNKLRTVTFRLNHQSLFTTKHYDVRQCCNIEKFSKSLWLQTHFPNDYVRALVNLNMEVRIRTLTIDLGNFFREVEFLMQNCSMVDTLKIDNLHLINVSFLKTVKNSPLTKCVRRVIVLDRTDYFRIYLKLSNLLRVLPNTYSLHFKYVAEIDKNLERIVNSQLTELAKLNQLTEISLELTEQWDQLLDIIKVKKIHHVLCNASLISQLTPLSNLITIKIRNGNDETLEHLKANIYRFSNLTVAKVRYDDGKKRVIRFRQN